MPNKKEEITDIIDPTAYDDPEFKKGLVFKFAQATIKVTKIDRKNKRTWGEHITLVNQRIVSSHHEHNIDSTKEAYDEFGVPFCMDCEVPVDLPSTEDGDKLALDRKDQE